MTFATKILFPTDFSPASEFCLEQATTLARARGATLLICHVEEPPLSYGGGEMYYGLPAAEERNLAELLEAVVPTHPAVPYEHRLLSGDPATEIVRLAEQEGVDLIVLGTHGRTGLKRLLMGSVAEAVVRRATCPVLTVKQPAEAPARN
jgi:nucleotide-binding universal stress UspA family protein